MRFLFCTFRGLLTLSLSITSLFSTRSLAAQDSSQEWLRQCREDWRAVHCEVRELRLPTSSALAVSAPTNGGISVQGWDRDEILVLARVRARAGSETEARDLASDVHVTAENGRIRATGPKQLPWRGQNWSVGYEVFVPRRMELSLSALNGGIRVADVGGELEMETTNGGISLSRVAGVVRGRTTNGGIDVRLTGDHWQGESLELRTTNGGIDLHVPATYSADLEARTVNGNVHTDFPLTVHGSIGKRIEAELGSGGAPLRLRTTNGGIRINRQTSVAER